MQRRKVVIFGMDDMLDCNLFSLLEDQCDVDYCSRHEFATPAAFLERAREADVICVNGLVSLTDDVLRQLHRTRLIVLWSTGYDYVDVAAAARYGIAVSNNGHFSTRSVAEFQFALLLALARKLPRLVSEQRHSAEMAYAVKDLLGLELHGKTLGLIGTGAIGLDTARIARGFSMRLLAYSRTVRPELETELGLRFVSLEELLSHSDVVSLNVPLSAETRHLLGPAEFARMKPGAILLNVSRGPVVDEEALIAALRSGRVAAAGVDVLENNAPDNPLRAMDNVIITPHVAWLTEDAIQRQADTIVENIMAYFAGDAQNVVNRTCSVELGLAGLYQQPDQSQDGQWNDRLREQPGDAMPSG
jgi:lactate dehydrogenase-like 2-hydroxyacid dehydrogenase